MALRMTVLKRNAKGGYSARKGIPRQLRAEYQRLYGAGWEAKFTAPKGSTFAEAKALFGEWLAEIETRIETLRAASKGEGGPLTKLQAIALAGEWYNWFVAKHQLDGTTSQQWRDLDDVYFWEVVMSEAPPEFREAAPHERDWTWIKDDLDVREKLRPAIAEQAQTALFLAHRGIALNTAALQRFVDEVEDNFIDAVQTLARNAAGDFTPDEIPKRFPRYEPNNEQDGNALSPMGLFEAWVNTAKPASSTVNRWRGVFVKLQERFSDVRSIRTTQARQWINELLAGERAPGTVDSVWLGAAKRVCKWGVDEALLQTNPFNDIKVTVPKVSTERETKAFTKDEASIILRAALAIEKPSTTFEFAKRWVPWLCAYSGARVGEITQLRASDIEKHGDGYFAKLSPSAGSIKNRQARSVPLHHHLIEQGFIKFVELRRGIPLFYNPSEDSKPKDPTNPQRARSVKTRDRLAGWVRSLGIDDNEIRPNHAWRHTFKAQAERASISEKISDAITGHAPASVGRTYGQPTKEDMAKAMQKFPRYVV